MERADADTVQYLAYGSNLHPTRLRQRVPSARLVGLVLLEGRALRFRKRSVDGSGKCDLAPRAGAHAYGALYRIALRERDALDRAEGLGGGYREQGLVLPGLGPAFCYIADPAHVDESLRPYHWYRELVLAGVGHLGLPAAYRAEVAGWAGRADPDPRRRAAHGRILQAATQTEGTRERPRVLMIVRFPEPGQRSVAG